MYELQIDDARVSKVTFADVSVVSSRYLFYSEVSGSDPIIRPTDEQLSDIFQNDLTMNVFRNGVYGTFRYLPLLSGCFRVFIALFSVSGELICSGS